MDIESISHEMAKHRANLIDSAAYAYVTSQLETIKEMGLDPLDYEVVLVRGDMISLDAESANGLKVVERIRVVKRGELN